MTPADNSKQSATLMSHFEPCNIRVNRVIGFLEYSSLKSTFSPGSRLRLSQFEFLRPFENSQEISRGAAGSAYLGTATKTGTRQLAALGYLSGDTCHTADRKSDMKVRN